MAEFDILVIGGGINGVGIARDAAGRGHSVLLCERDDLAQATSSASSKLVHGGLRYLEQFQFRLVREALREREVLLRAAPHLVEPLQFILPHSRDLRPGWLIRLGLALYDNLGARKRLPASRKVALSDSLFGQPLKAEATHGFAYSDCRVDDSRLVVLNALDAFAQGAQIRTRTSVEGIHWDDGAWQAALHQSPTNETQTVSARSVVNASGPWVGGAVAGAVSKNIRLVKGSHITVPKLYDGDHAYILQNADQRVVFVIPYQADQSLIGTTDVEYEGDPGRATCSEDEIAYLCGAVNRWFDREVRPADVLWSYAGVRPLLDDGAGNAASVTRDYRLDLEPTEGKGPLLTVVGGKITTYRKLAEQAVDRLQPLLGGGQSAWTAGAVLPGGDLPQLDFASFLVETKRRYAWFPEDVVVRLARAYGTRIEQVFGTAASIEDLGANFGAGLFEAELGYLKREEWAVTAEDVLWRRSKLGLLMTDAERKAVARWFD